MLNKSRTKKACRYTPVAIESKLKPLPNIGNSAPPKVPSACPCKTTRTRNCGAVSKSNSRSTDRTVRSGSVTDREGPLIRSGKVFHAVNKKARGGLKYKSYGRSSDPCYDDSSSRHVFPDPYADLKSNLDSSLPLDPNAPWWLFLAEMRLQARRQAVNLDSKQETVSTRQVDKLDKNLDLKLDSSETRKLDAIEGKRAEGGDARKVDGYETRKRDVCQARKMEAKVEVKRDASEEKTGTGRHGNRLEDETKGGADTVVSSAKGNVNENKVKDHKSEDDAKGTADTVGDDDNENDDDDDEEEDESGLPQAVRAMQPKSPTPNAREVARERQKAMMEEIARTVGRNNLMSHLKAGGFFHHDYSPFARTSSANHNLRKGKKKGIERLLMLLQCRPTKCTGELFGHN